MARRYARPHQRRVVIDPPHLRLADFAAEVWAGITQRPGRTTLTMFGTLLGIGALVAVLGLTATAAGQIGAQFSQLDATVATATFHGPASDLDAFLDPGSLLRQLHGLLGSGIYWQAPSTEGGPAVATQPGEAAGTGISVYAASPGLFTAVEGRVTSGTTYNSFHERTAAAVAVLGSVAAADLGIYTADSQRAIFINGSPYLVIGIIAPNTRLPQLDLSAIIPTSAALTQFGPPDPASPAQIYMRTQLGAAPLVAQQAPIALDPADPTAFSAIAAPNPTTLGAGISRTISGLLLLLAVVTVVVGAFAIANTTLVAVMERTSEIGIRRAHGARPHHIAAQFLAESAATGLVGGLIGTSLGIIVVVVTAILRHWTAVLSPLDVFPPPLGGAFIGLLAGAYPAWRATRIEPAVALRR